LTPFKWGEATNQSHVLNPFKSDVFWHKENRVCWPWGHQRSLDVSHLLTPWLTQSDNLSNFEWSHMMMTDDMTHDHLQNGHESCSMDSVWFTKLIKIRCNRCSSDDHPI
jgi:hypothetical protein